MLRLLFVSFMIFTLVPVLNAQSEEMRRAAPPDDCLIYINQTSESGIVDWRDMVEVEHCDRMKRLQQIASLSGTSGNVEFYDASIAANLLPPNVRVRLPLLRVVFPEQVFFDTDSSQMRPEAFEIVNIVAESLRAEPPDVTLFIAGHADERGSADYNYNLSIDRANALAESVLASGVNVASVWRVGFGEDMPLEAGSNEHAWSRNRRIEFLFSARPEAVAVWLADKSLDLTCKARTASEAEDCKAKLDLKTEYDILEVVSSETLVSPTAGQGDVDLNAVKASVNPTLGGSDVHPSTAKQIIHPRAPRKIRIDPVNRRAGKIEKS